MYWRTRMNSTEVATAFSLQVVIRSLRVSGLLCAERGIILRLHTRRGTSGPLHHLERVHSRKSFELLEARADGGSGPRAQRGPGSPPPNPSGLSRLRAIP